MENKMGKYKELAEQIGNLVEEKNAAYGNSFDQAGDFLRLLYPNGIPPESYGDMLCVVRIFDKLKRIATRKDAFSESPYGDIIGYGLLGLNKDLEANKKKIPEEEKISVKCKICNEMIEAAIPLSEYKSDGNYVHLECFQKHQSENKTNIIPTETINTVE